MKKIFIAVVAGVFAFCVGSAAQSYTDSRLGIVAGFTSSSSTVKDVDTKSISLYHAGLAFEIPLGGGFALTPQWYAENGNEWHFERRYGPRRNGGKYHSGMQASNFILELSWKATKNLSFFVSVQQFDIVSADARRSVKAHSSPCMRRDLTVGTIGCRIRF